MPSVRRVITTSLISTVSPECSKNRRDDLEKISNPVQRLGAVALHNFASRYPKQAARLLGLDYHEVTMPALSGGREHNVFRISEGEVLKVDWRSLLMNKEALEVYAQQRANEHLAQVRSLGPFAVAHSATGIQPHPLFPNRPAIYVTQPYHEVSDPGLFAIDDVQEMSAVVATMTAHEPSMPEQLLEFVDRSKTMQQRYGLVPDILGECNVVLHAGQLCVIDGQPISQRADPDIRAYAQAQLVNLEEAVAIAT